MEAAPFLLFIIAELLELSSPISGESSVPLHRPEWTGPAKLQADVKVLCRHIDAKRPLPSEMSKKHVRTRM